MSTDFVMSEVRGNLWTHGKILWRAFLLPVRFQECQKKTFEEEFWCHAPNVLKYWREKALEDPINHRSITRYAIHLKLYKYQIQNPLYRYPDNAGEKSKEQGRICANIIPGTWGNFE